MTEPQPRYAPGDPVLVAGEVVHGPSGRENYVVAVRSADGGKAWPRVRLSDVHPVPPTPDPRDTAIAAVRALCQSAPEVDRQSSWNDGYVEALAEVREILDGVILGPASHVVWPRPRWKALEEAAAAAPATTDDRVDVVAHAVAPWTSSDQQAEAIAREVVAALNAHRAAGSPS